MSDFHPHLTIRLPPTPLPAVYWGAALRVEPTPGRIFLGGSVSPTRPRVMSDDSARRRALSDGRPGSSRSGNGPPRPSVAAGPERPLVITDDGELLEDVLRIAAAAGVELIHSPEPAARAVWRTTPLVLIDSRLVAAALRARLPRRPGVVVVARTLPTPDVWEQCIRLGAERTVFLDAAVSPTGADRAVRVDDAGHTPAGNAAPDGRGLVTGDLPLGTRVLPDGGEQALVTLLADSALPGPGDGRSVAVIGGCGGAGASVFAIALAVAAARSDQDALLVDCDPMGPGLDLLLGIENHNGIRWHQVAAPAGRLPEGALRRALPSVAVGRGRVALLCHDRDDATQPDARVVEVVLDSGRRWGGVMIIDLPRHVSEVADRVAERADLTVLIAPAEVRGCFAAQRVATRLRLLGSRVGLVVRGPSPGGLGPEDVAAVLGLPLLASMRAEPGVARDLDGGRIPGLSARSQLARAAASVIRALGQDPRGTSPS